MSGGKAATRGLPRPRRDLRLYAEFQSESTSVLAFAVIQGCFEAKSRDLAGNPDAQSRSDLSLLRQRTAAALSPSLSYRPAAL